MPNYRRGRINDAVAKELAICLRDARDPRILDNFVSITRWEVAPDLKVARVYYSTLGDAAAAGAGLRAAQGMLRRHLAETLNLRITPELLFASDKSGEHGARISALLKQIREEDEARAESGAQARDGEESEETP